MDALKKDIDDGLTDKKHYEGAKSLVLSILEHYLKETGEIHMPTVVGAAAAICGERALRLCHPEIYKASSQYIRSEDVENLVFWGDEESLSLTEIVLYFSSAKGGFSSNQDWFNDIIFRTLAAFGGDLFPALSTPEDYFLHEWSPNAQPVFRGLVDFISANHDIKDLDLVNMLATAVGTMIEMAEDIEGDCNDKDILVQLAFEIMYGCACIPPVIDKVGSR